MPGVIVYDVGYYAIFRKHKKMKAAGPRMHLIVAVSENMGIGKDNALPWRLKSEMKYFAQMTRTTVDPNKKGSGCSLIYI